MGSCSIEGRKPAKEERDRGEDWQLRAHLFGNPNQRDTSFLCISDVRVRWDLEVISYSTAWRETEREAEMLSEGRVRWPNLKVSSARVTMCLV